MVSISFPADSSNRSLNVRIVNKGEKYGLNRSLAHDQDEPLVEFYEAPCDQDHSQPYRALTFNITLDDFYSHIGVSDDKE